MFEDVFEDDYQPRLQWALWRRMLAFTWPYRRLVGLMCCVAVVIAGCDAAIPYLTGRIIDAVTTGGEGASLVRYGVAFGAAVTLLSFNVFAFIALAGRISTSVAHDIRRAGFDHLQELSFSYFDSKAVGWLMARMTSDCHTLSRIMAWAMMDVVWGFSLMGIIAGVMLSLNVGLALVVMAVMPPLGLATKYFSVRILINSRRARKLNSLITASFGEGLQGVRTTKSFVRESANLAQFERLTREMGMYSLRGATYSAIYLPLVITVCSAGVGMALWAGGLRVLGGSISVGMLVTFLAYAGQLANPVQDMANTLTALQGAQASAERIVQLLDTEPEVRDTPAAKARIAAHRAAQASAPAEAQTSVLVGATADAVAQGPALAEDGLPVAVREIEFRGVGFSYATGPVVLQDVDLTVRAGQTVALVGATGGGKSTLVNLACRFYEPTRGGIYFDGIEYRERSLRWLQSIIGAVPQAPYLFRDSVRQNIRYGRLDASDEQVERAARLVNAHDFIVGLEKGYDTDVGEGGGKLSTGQKQLISLARAVLADPQVLVMDEATSSVDTQTEKLIQTAVERVLAGRISFVVAHRLSTIRNAQIIAVIDGGRVVERGTHDELIARGGRYHELYTQQFAHEAEDSAVAPALPPAPPAPLAPLVAAGPAGG